MSSAASVVQVPAVRVASFYFVSNYQLRGPRVLMLVGTRWREPLRRHYGIDGGPFYTRPALPGELDVDAKGHPWGWVYKPDELLMEEARWSTPEQIEHLRSLLEAACCHLESV